MQNSGAVPLTRLQLCNKVAFVNAALIWVVNLGFELHSMTTLSEAVLASIFGNVPSIVFTYITMLISMWIATGKPPRQFMGGIKIWAIIVILFQIGVFMKAFSLQDGIAGGIYIVTSWTLVILSAFLFRFFSKLIGY